MKKLASQAFKAVMIMSISGSVVLHADTAFHFKETGIKNKTTDNTIYIKDGKMLFSDAGSNSGEFSIFDSSKKRMIHISPQQRAYMIMDEQTIDMQMNSMKQQMDTMMAQMKEQMENMPPEQRKMVEQMMAQQGAMPPGIASGDNASSVPQAKKINTGRTLKIAGISCRISNIMYGSKIAEEQCIADEKDLNINLRDRETVQEMKQFMKNLSSKATSIMGSDAGMPDDFDGVPLRTRHFDKSGKLVYESVLQSVSKDKINPDKLSIPAGYKEQKMY